jgi:hypothetical protein
MGMQAYLLMHDGTEHKVGDGSAEIERFRCGVCCVRYRPKVTLKEIERIARKLAMSIDAFSSTYVQAVLTKEAYILQNSADTCPFLRWDEGVLKLLALSMPSGRRPVAIGPPVYLDPNAGKGWQN